MTDIFGYTKEISHELASSSAVKVSINRRTLHLAQECTIKYGRTVSANVEIGSETIYMTAGHAKGICTFSRLVGRDSFFSPYLTGVQGCSGVTLNVESSGGRCSVGGGDITMTNAMLVSVNTTIQAENVQIVDSAEFQIGGLSVSGGASA